jgi:hypothetical protein
LPNAEKYPRDRQLGVDAARIEPVSTSKFPANREKNREFRGNRPREAIFAPNRLPNSVVYNRIPYATEQGIIRGEQGIFYKEQGVFAPNGATLDFAFLSPTKEESWIVRSHHLLKGKFFSIVRIGTLTLKGCVACGNRAWQLPFAPCQSRTDRL